MRTVVQFSAKRSDFYLAIMNRMGKVIYLDWFRPQEPKLPPFTMCGGLQAPYVVDPSRNPYVEFSDKADLHEFSSSLVCRPTYQEPQ